MARLIVTDSCAREKDEGRIGTVGPATKLKKRDSQLFRSHQTVYCTSNTKRVEVQNFDEYHFVYEILNENSSLIPSRKEMVNDIDISSNIILRFLKRALIDISY